MLAGLPLVLQFRSSLNSRRYCWPINTMTISGMFLKLKGYLPQIIITHMDPALEEEIASEVADVSEPLGTSITRAREGMELHIQLYVNHRHPCRRLLLVVNSSDKPGLHNSSCSMGHHWLRLPGLITRRSLTLIQPPLPKYWKGRPERFPFSIWRTLRYYSKRFAVCMSFMNCVI